MNEMWRLGNSFVFLVVVTESYDVVLNAVDNRCFVFIIEASDNQK
jgi:hypothetical protein